VERSPRRLFNALANNAALPPNIRAFGDSVGIVFGEADPPCAMLRRVFALSCS